VVATKDLKQSCYSKPYMKREVEQGMNHEAHHLVELISGRIWQSKLEKLSESMRLPKTLHILISGFMASSESLHWQRQAFNPPDKNF
jgi:hypothetical protein